MSLRSREIYIVDVGANYGEMIFNATLPPGATVIAFEPNPWISPYLEINLLCAGIKATVLRCALSRTAGKAPLFIDRKWSGNSRLVSAADETDVDPQEVLLVFST